MKLGRRPAGPPGPRDPGAAGAGSAATTGPTGPGPGAAPGPADGPGAPDVPPAAPRSPLLGLAGAVEATGPDAGVAAHYGRPAQEQRALEAGRAFVDLSHLAVLAVDGPDRLSWLHDLTTQHLTDLAPGVPTELAVLDPNGHVEHAASAIDDGRRTWLFTERGDGPALAGFLDRMRFTRDVRVETRDDLALLGAHGAGLGTLTSVAGGLATDRPGAGSAGTSGTAPSGTAPSGTAGGDEAPDGVAPPPWRDPWPHTREGSTTYGAPDADHPAADLVRGLVAVPRAALRDVAGRLAHEGLTPAGVWAWEALRVAAVRPRLGLDVDARTLPHELDWLRTTTHLTKGCYRGQETVARVVNLGRPPRRLVLLHLDGSRDHLPEPGAPVLAGTREVGRVTSAVRHVDDGPIALAVVRRALDPAAALMVDGVDAAQEAVVTPDGEPAERPAKPDRAGLRRRDLGGPRA